MSKSLYSVYAEFNLVEEYWKIVHVEPYPCLSTPIKNFEWFLLGIYFEEDYINASEHIISMKCKTIYMLRMNLMINNFKLISI